MAARPPTVGVGAGGTIVAAVAAAVAAAAAAASSCDPVAAAVPRGGSSVVAALPAACGALSKRRLIGTDTSDLSALAGARAGTDEVTLRTKKHKTEY
jgi:type IV secretory pathway TrbL component